MSTSSKKVFLGVKLNKVDWLMLNASENETGMTFQKHATILHASSQNSTCIMGKMKNQTCCCLLQFASSPTPVSSKQEDLLFFKFKI